MNEHHLKEDIFRILRLLASQDDLSQRDLSGHLGISLGKTNYLIKELIKGGLIKITNFAKGEQKLKKVGYVLTKQGFHTQLELTHHFLKIKEKEYLELKKEAEKVSNMGQNK